MSYLVLQIILYLVAAALIGLGFGWRLGRRGVAAALEELRVDKDAVIADWRSRHQEALDLGEVARTRIAALESSVDRLREELQAKSERLIELESQSG